MLFRSSNAAALYVLGVGFAFFAAKAQSPFMTGVCFWFSVFLLCDCLRLARICSRLERNDNLILVADESGITHHVCWLEPEHRSWKEITGLRSFKAPNSETIYFQSKPRPEQFWRFALFGSPKFDLPLSCIPGGKETLLKALSMYPGAKHLVPERADFEAPAKAA